MPAHESSLDSMSAAASVELAVEACLQRYPANHIYVAYSGGVDSTALLIAAKNFMSGCPNTRGRPNKRGGSVSRLTAVYIDHGLAGQSQDWLQHTQEVCLQLGVALEVRSVDVSPVGNLEANARTARYRAFAEVMRDDGVLLLGHHQLDQTETILMRLFQGRGMQPMRNSGILGPCYFARPLLPLSRAQLVSYVDHHGVPWVEDPSNFETHLARNFLRHEIVPRLSAHWHNLHTAVQRVAHDLHAGDEALIHALRGLPKKVSLELIPTAPAVRLAWLRAYLSTRGVYDVRDAELFGFCQQDSVLTQVQLGRVGVQLHIYNGSLYFEADCYADQPASTHIGIGRILELPHGTLQLEVVNADHPLAIPYKGAFAVRFRQGGETITPARRSRQRLKNLLNEHRMPPWQRDSYPLLFQADMLVCVPGVAVSETFAKLQQSTAQENALWVVAVWEDSHGT